MIVNKGRMLRERVPRRWMEWRIVVALMMISAGEEGARSQCQYEGTIVQVTECATIGRGINEFGDIVGRFRCDFGGDEAFIWTPGGGLQTLPRLPGFEAARALDVNDSDEVVGYMTVENSAQTFGVLWREGTALNLGTLPPGNRSEASAINNSVQIVGLWGNSVTGDPAVAAFRWENGTMRDIHLPLGPHGVASDITESGWIVGWMGETPLNGGHAFLWQYGAVTDLGVIEGGFGSAACAINVLGEVVGRGYLTDDDPPGWVRHAFHWREGEMIDLGTLPGFRSSLARDINEAGQIVGLSFDGGGPSRAFLSQGAAMIDLNDLVQPGLGVLITGASGINDAGQIVGSGAGPDGGVAVVLTPVGQPLGDLNGDCRVNLSDLLIVLSNWGPCKVCRGDVNQDGNVDIADLLIVLSNWG